MVASNNEKLNMKIIKTMGSHLRHLESCWIFYNRLHGLVEFFYTENVKHVSC